MIQNSNFHDFTIERINKKAKIINEELFDIANYFDLYDMKEEVAAITAVAMKTNHIIVEGIRKIR